MNSERSQIRRDASVFPAESYTRAPCHTLSPLLSSLGIPSATPRIALQAPSARSTTQLGEHLSAAHLPTGANLPRRKGHAAGYGAAPGESQLQACHHHGECGPHSRASRPTALPAPASSLPPCSPPGPCSPLLSGTCASCRCRSQALSPPPAAPNLPSTRPPGLPAAPSASQAEASPHAGLTPSRELGVARPPQLGRVRGAPELHTGHPGTGGELQAARPPDSTG